MEKVLHCNRCLLQRCATCINFCSRRHFHLAYPAHRQTHYDILGVGKDATTHEIREAFVKLSKEIHPDLNQDDPENHKKFVLLNEAYNVLSKLKTRREYDQFLQHPQQTGFAEGTYYHGPGANDEEFADPYYNAMGATPDRMEYYNVRGMDKRSNGQVAIIGTTAVLLGTVSFIIALMYSYKKQRDYDIMLRKQNKMMSEEKKRYDRKFTTAEQLESFILEHQRMATGIANPGETLASSSNH